jgi:hypothetical protein
LKVLHLLARFFGVLVRSLHRIDLKHGTLSDASEHVHDRCPKGQFFETGGSHGRRDLSGNFERLEQNCLELWQGLGSAFRKPLPVKFGGRGTPARGSFAPAEEEGPHHLIDEQKTQDAVLCEK